MRNFCLAAFLVLRFLLGNAETGEKEEITDFLYEYASHFGDYLYATVEYYTENITVIPTMLSDWEYLEDDKSMGSPLQCHLPLVILFSLLQLLL